MAQYLEVEILNRDDNEVKAAGVDLVEIDIDFRFITHPIPLDVAIRDIFQDVDDQLGDLFSDIIDEEYDLHRDDRVGIRLDIDGNIFYKMAKVRNDPFQHLINFIEEAIQSELELLFKTWELRLQLFRVPRGRGNPRRLAYNDADLKNKRSVISIRNNDGLCMWRSIVVSLYYQKSREEHCLGLQEEERKQRKKEYEKIKRANSAEQQRQAQALYTAIGANIEGTIEDLPTVANHLQWNITVLNMRCSRFIEYRTALHTDRDFSRTLYILRQNDHFHAISTITGFLACNYYCDACDVRSKTRDEHRCQHEDGCFYCHKSIDEHENKLEPAKQCTNCFRIFDYNQCYDKHLEKMCRSSWKCALCRKCYPFSHPKEKHECWETLCRRCNVYKRGDHKCFIQPKPAKLPLADEKIRYFDFESDCTPHQNHIVNLAVVSSDGADFVIYENHGESVIDEFCKGEFCMKNRGCTYVAHNAKGYDSQFIKEALSRLSYRFEIIPNGNKIIMLMLKVLNIRIIDSSCFIQAPLRDFPKTFKLSNKKGMTLR